MYAYIYKYILKSMCTMPGKNYGLTKLMISIQLLFIYLFYFKTNEQLKNIFKSWSFWLL